MGDKPHTSDDVDEIDVDDDKLGSTLESPLDEQELKASSPPHVDSVDAGPPSDRPTVPKGHDDGNGSSSARPNSSYPPGGPVTGPPRPKSVRPPAPLPAPGSVRPLSTRSTPPTGLPASKLPPPPPPPRSGTSSPPSKKKSLPPPRSRQMSAPQIEVEDPTTEDRQELIDLDDETVVRKPSRPPTAAHDEGDESPAPPGIPSLAKGSEDDAHDKGQKEPKKRRSKKGRRRTVRIPDDDVPNAGGEDDDAIADDPSEDDFEYDRPTFIMPEKDVEDAVNQAVNAAGAASSDDDGDDAPEIDPDEEVEEGTTRQSAPGIFTDEMAIAVLRPIEVTNDLPMMESAKHDDDGPLPTSRRPPPPRRTDRPDQIEPPLEAIEEIVPDRMSLPGAEAAAAAEIGDLDSRPRRPLPPPRSAMASDPGLLLEAQNIEASGAPMPTGLDALQAAENQLAVAEEAARKAEELARQAEVRAKEAADRAKEAGARKQDSKRPKKPWWVEMFEDDYIRTLDNPKKRDVEKEVKFIATCLRLEKGSRVLDLACGHGVHAVELAAKGYQVVGVDLSNAMLSLAKEYNTKRNTSVSFIQGDMRELNLDGVFDGVYCWSTSFGYFDEQRNANVLERVHRALRPGGRFALDIANRDYVAPRSPTMAWFEKPGCVCMDEARFDFYTSRLVTKRMVMFETGKSRELEMSIRLYTLHELGRLLQQVGFKVLEVSGHRAHRGAYFGAESPRVIIVAERKADD